MPIIIAGVDAIFTNAPSQAEDTAFLAMPLLGVWWCHLLAMYMHEHDAALSLSESLAPSQLKPNLLPALLLPRLHRLTGEEHQSACLSASLPSAAVSQILRPRLRVDSIDQAASQCAMALKAVGMHAAGCIHCNSMCQSRCTSLHV